MRTSEQAAGTAPAPPAVRYAEYGVLPRMRSRREMLAAAFAAPPHAPAPQPGRPAATTPPNGDTPMPLEPTTQKFIDSLAGAPPMHTLSPEAAHAVLTDLQSRPVPMPDAEITDTTFPVGPTGTTRIRIVRPRGASGVLPVLMYFHGGGWVLGDKITHDRLVRELAVGTGAAVVFVDYVNSPEARYPTQNEQAYASLLYVVEHARELNVDASRLAVMGDSVGANMTAVVTLMALVVRDVWQPARDVVRRSWPGTDDPAGGVLDGAPDRFVLRRRTRPQPPRELDPVGS